MRIYPRLKTGGGYIRRNRLEIITVGLFSASQQHTQNGTNNKTLIIISSPLTYYIYTYYLYARANLSIYYIYIYCIYWTDGGE